MAMSRKHYQATAAILADVQADARDGYIGTTPEKITREIGARMAGMFKADNARFNRDYFYEAAHIADTVSTAPEPVKSDGVLEAFAAVFADSLSALHLAERMSCAQVEALADVLEAAGRPEDAAEWRGQHEATDEPGDMHHPDALSDDAFDAEFIGA